MNVDVRSIGRRGLQQPPQHLLHLACSLNRRQHRCWTHTDPSASVTDPSASVLDTHSLVSIGAGHTQRCRPWRPSAAAPASPASRLQGPRQSALVLDTHRSVSICRHRCWTRTDLSAFRQHRCWTHTEVSAVEALSSRPSISCISPARRHSGDTTPPPNITLAPPRKAPKHIPERIARAEWPFLRGAADQGERRRA